MRTVRIFKSPDFDTATELVPQDIVWKAIGCLAKWALRNEGEPSGRYADCEIGLRADGNIDAVYKNESGETNYVIFGVLNSDSDGNPTHYSFHS